MSENDKEELCTEVLLDTARHCFEHEIDRTKRIEGKANMCIVVIGIIFTLLVGYLNFNYINNIWKGICISIFIISIIAYFVSIGYFLKVLQAKPYRILEYEKIFSSENFKCYKCDMEESLITEYKKILMDIYNNNEKKADYYNYGIISTIIGTIASFILIFIDFIM